MTVNDSELKYRHLVENSLQGVVILQGLKIVYVNKAFAQITGYSVDELLSLNPDGLNNLIHPDDRDMVWDNFRKRMSGLEIPPHYNFKGITKDGRLKILDLYASVIDFEDKPAIQGLILDITEQVEAEEKLRHRTQLIETIVSNLPIGIAVIEVESGKNILMNKEFRNVLDVDEEGTKYLERILTKSNIKRTGFKGSIDNDQIVKQENLIWDNVEIFTKSGDKKFITAKMITLPEQKIKIYTVTDISERLYTEKFLQKSVVEKEILLREIHHRVKNNLQTISSLLDLQAGSITQPEILEAFRSSQSRIRSMALIHERLYKSENLSKIKACEYIKNLVEYLEGTYYSPSRNIEISTDVEDLYLTLDIAIPCGLIINELVSNSMKHAFPQNKNGNIRISLRHNDSVNLVLKIEDNGVGIPLNFNTLNYQSLGLELVKLMVKQLNGQMSLDGTAGTAITINFLQPALNIDAEN